MIHGLIPFVFFVVLLVSLVRGSLNKIPNVKKDIFLTLTLIFAHVQLLLGIVVLMPMLVDANWGAVMADSASRYLLVEHPLTMIIGVVLITVGKVKAKKAIDNAKGNKVIFSYFLIALVLIALRTPWDKLIS